MRFISLDIFRRAAGSQQDTLDLTSTEKDFIANTAFPPLDASEDDKVLEKLADALWNLCLWEGQRATTLDTKAATLTGLSSLAAAVVSASATGQTVGDGVTIARCASIALFILTVLLALYAQRAFRQGAFFDEDVFAALQAHKVPVGEVPAFKDANPYRCFLREISLQRWLVYRKQSDANDAKFHRLLVAQYAAAVATSSLIATVIMVLRH